MRRLIMLTVTPALLLATSAIARQTAPAEQQPLPATSCAQPAPGQAQDAPCTPAAPVAILNVSEFDLADSAPAQLEFRQQSVADFYNQRHAPPPSDGEPGNDLYAAPASAASGERTEYRAFGLRYACEERADGTRCIGGSSSSTQGDEAASAAQSEAERIVNERLDALSRP